MPEEMTIIDKCAKPAIIIGAILIFLAIAYGAWSVKRWANWKFGYGPRVERRLESIETRLELLENKTGDNY